MYRVITKGINDLREEEKCTTLQLANRKAQDMLSQEDARCVSVMRGADRIADFYRLHGAIRTDLLKSERIDAARADILQLIDEKRSGKITVAQWEQRVNELSWIYHISIDDILVMSGNKVPC